MWFAAVEPSVEDPRQAITLAIIGLLSAMGVALVGGIFSWLTARANKRPPSGPVPVPAPVAPPAVIDLPFRDYVVGELAVAKRRDDDNDERDDVQDRRHISSEHRLDQLEWYLDLTNPEWRHGR